MTDSRMARLPKLLKRLAVLSCPVRYMNSVASPVPVDNCAQDGGTVQIRSPFLDFSCLELWAILPALGPCSVSVSKDLHSHLRVCTRRSVSAALHSK